MTTYLHALDPSGNLVPLHVDADGHLIISGDITIGDVTVDNIEISNDVGNPVPVSGTTANAGVTITAAQSTAAVDVAGTTVSGGTSLYNAATPPANGYAIDLTPYELFIPPGETWVFSM